MASPSSLYSPFIQSFDPSSKTRTLMKPSSNRTKTLAYSRRDNHAHNHNFKGRLVDENLIVLRKRIHEANIIEKNYEPPSEWMNWERRLYASYDSVICDAMGHLQTYLMETRPSLILGMVALIALSLPTSIAMVMYHLFQLIK